MAVSEREAAAALERLGRRGLVGTASGAGHRVAKHRHTLDAALGLSRRELAALAVLILRGPQTAGEIGSRGGRMGLSGAGDAADVLATLADRDEPLAMALPREPGQSANRYAHALMPLAETAPEAPPEAVPEGDSLYMRVDRLEAEVAALRDELAGLRERLGD